MTSIYIYILKMCLVSTNGKRASPLCHFSYNTLDKHANIYVKSSPEYQKVVHISAINVYLHVYRLLDDRYPQILHMYAHINSYIRMP